MHVDMKLVSHFCLVLTEVTAASLAYDFVSLSSKILTEQWGLDGRVVRAIQKNKENHDILCTDQCQLHSSVLLHSSLKMAY